MEEAVRRLLYYFSSECGVSSDGYKPGSDLKGFEMSESSELIAILTAIPTVLVLV
jgi:hypothetical protein